MEFFAGWTFHESENNIFAIIYYLPLAAARQKSRVIHRCQKQLCIVWVTAATAKNESSFGKYCYEQDGQHLLDVPENFLCNLFDHFRQLSETFYRPRFCCAILFQKETARAKAITFGTFFVSAVLSSTGARVDLFSFLISLRLPCLLSQRTFLAPFPVRN